MRKTTLYVSIPALALSLGATAFTAQPVLAQSSAQTAVDFPINLNTATDEQILAVPGIVRAF